MSGELNRLHSAFNSVFHVIRSPTATNTSQDEETPIMNNNINSSQNNSIPEMPGAFTFPAEVDNETNNTTSNSISIRLPKILDRLFTVLIISVFLVVFIPVYICYRIVLYLFFIVLSIIIKINRHGYNLIKNNDPANTARRFIMRFDDRIGNKGKTTDSEESNDNSGERVDINSSSSTLIRENHLQEIERPDFLECAYSHALFIVKKEIRWLLVYIESDQNNDAIKFTNDVLINEKFLKFIKEREILVWGNDISESEAFQVCNQFKVTKLPFLGLFCLTVNQTPTTSGMQSSLPVLSLVMKIQGYKSLDSTLKKMNRAYAKYNPAIVQLRQSYLNSVETNSSSSDSIQRAYREFRDNRSSPIIQSLERNNTEEARLQWLKWRKSRLIPENNIEGEFSRIAIRLVDGSRKQYKIDKHSSTEELYALVECTILNDVQIDADDEEYEEPANYRHDYKFELVNVFPRVVLPISYNESIEDVDYLYPSGNLVISID